jgi:hypothetical protein
MNKRVRPPPRQQAYATDAENISNRTDLRTVLNNDKRNQLRLSMQPRLSSVMIVTGVACVGVGSTMGSSACLESMEHDETNILSIHAHGVWCVYSLYLHLDNFACPQVHNDSK